MALRSRNYSPSGLATLNPHAFATDLGQGLNLRAGSEQAPLLPRSLEQDPRPEHLRKNAEGPKKHIHIYITHKYGAPLRAVGCSPRGNARRDATGENSQPPSSGAPRSMRVIPNERNN